MLYNLPYGNVNVSVDINSKQHNVRIVKPNNIPATISDEKKEIKRALLTPINSRHLSEIAESRKRAVIIVNDTTRPIKIRCKQMEVLEIDQKKKKLKNNLKKKL